MCALVSTTAPTDSLQFSEYQDVQEPQELILFITNQICHPMQVIAADRGRSLQPLALIGSGF
jgi:hypothetical protein